MKHESIYDWMDYTAKKLQKRLKPDIDIDDWMWGDTCFQFVLVLNASSRERAYATDPYAFYYHEDEGTVYQQIDDWIEDRLYRFLKEKPRMTRVDYDIESCTGDDGFDWDKFQYLCDIAEAWDMEE